MEYESKETKSGHSVSTDIKNMRDRLKTLASENMN
jgi:hypothetical protein